MDPEAEVFLFGSVAEGKYVFSSDIDILIITKKTDQKYNIMVEAYKTINAPIELHITTNEKFEKWYKKFIKPEELEEI